MSRTIWKFPLEVADEQVVKMPENSRIIHAGTQDGVTMCLWALINDTQAPKVYRHIVIRGTGHPFPENGSHKHLGTCFLHGGKIVFHIFENESPTI